MAKRKRPPRQSSTAHGELVRIWMYLARHSKGRSRSRAKLEVYLASPEFLTSLAKLDAARRLLALQAVGAAFDRLTAPPAARPGPRLVWSEDMKERLRDAARRLPTDHAIARELRLPIAKVTPMRHKLCGPKAGTPHITQVGPLRLAA